jgi:hypothetical protein
MRRPRVAQILKLSGTLLCGVILIAMFTNRYDWFDFDNRQLAVRFSGGDLAMTWFDTKPAPRKPIFFGLLLSLPQNSPRQIWHVRFPLWPVLLAIALPALCLWRIDRQGRRSAAAATPSAKPRGQLHRRRARRRLLKRATFAALFAAAVALLVSTRTAAVLIEPTGRCGAGLTRGTLLLFYSIMPIEAFRTTPDVIEVGSISWRGHFTGNPLTPALPRYATFGANTLKVLVLPLSTLLIALGVVIVALWLIDFRRVRPEDCPECGYNLTGNTSGVCPECGYKRPLAGAVVKAAEAQQAGR